MTDLNLNEMNEVRGGATPDETPVIRTAAEIELANHAALNFTKMIDE